MADVREFLIAARQSRCLHRGWVSPPCSRLRFRAYLTNQIVCALRFFYAKTLNRAFMLEEIPFPRTEQRLPLILSREEVARILTAPPHLKTRALLMTIYAAGLRRSDAARLRVNDIDSARMTITVRQGKGQKDRVVMLSTVLLQTLRQYWRHYKPKQWLFPGKNPDQPISDNDIFGVFQNAVRRAGITKKVSPHSLRHYLPFLTMSCKSARTQFSRQLREAG